MEQTLHALAGILLKAIPTIILVLLLHWYLKAMLFQPLANVLKKRDEMTKGARKRAEESTQMAAKRAAEFDQAIVDARAELYREQEHQRNQWLEDQAAQIRAAKDSANQAVASARGDMQQQTVAAKQTLAGTSESLAEEIAQTILGKGVHA